MSRMIGIRCWLVAVFIGLCSLGNLFAQTVSFIHLGVENGLVQSQVQTVCQDPNGHLWIGTLAGLTRYSGHRSQHYLRNDSLAEEWITACHVNHNTGDMWLGHWGGGLTYYNAADQQFRSLNFELVGDFRTITDIQEDEQGDAWIATEGSGVFRYLTAENRFEALAADPRMLSLNVTAISMDVNERLWLGTDAGVTILNPKAGEGSTDRYVRLTVEDGLPSNTVTDLIRLSNRNMMVATTNGAVIISYASNKINREGFIHFNTSNGLSSNRITNLLEDRQGNIWLGTENAGVNRYSVVTRSVTNYNVRNGLNYNSINDLFQDREGNIWIATDLGLNLFRGEIFQLYNRRDSLSHNIVWAMMEDSQRDLWLGTHQGLTRMTFPSELDPGAVNKTRQVQRYDERHGLPDSRVMSVFEDRDGAIWVGMWSGGPARLKPGSDRFERIPGIGGPEGTVFSISQDQYGYIWFGTRYGAYRLDIHDGDIATYTTENGLGGDHIFRIFRDSKDRLWFAAIGGELAVYENNRFRQFSAADGIEHKLIMTMAEDEQENLWFGAYGGGLYRYNGERFVNYNVNNGLRSNTPYSIIADDQDRIWIGTNSGVDCFDPSDETLRHYGEEEGWIGPDPASTAEFFTHYGQEEGFLGVEANPHAICKDSWGNIWFGTIMGAVKYNPDEDLINEVEPLVFIEAPKILNRPDDPEPANREYTYEQRHLAFNFLAVSLTNPKKIRYQYRLEGFDEEWSDAGPVPQATYSNLSPGDYVFKVRAANSHGIWSAQPLEYAFSIQPPFWRAWWFYLSIFILVLVAALAVDGYRTRNLMDIKAMLENKVRLRTQELDQKNQELAHKNRNITESLEYARKIQSAILPQLGLLQQHLDESFVIHKPRDIVSGDFYWAQPTDKGLLLASVDCSGHGVPGALLSLLAFNNLNRAVSEFRLQQPHEILDKLNTLMAESLHEHQASPGSDTLDVAICLVDQSGKHLHYAGANSSIFVVQSIGMESVNLMDKVSAAAQKVTLPEHPFKLTEVKADKHPIDGLPTKHGFTNHEIDLHAGDSVYFVTRGFANQFGGERGKKFKINRLKQLILFHQDKSMAALKEVLEQTFDEWKGDLEQIDDLCMIGFRIPEGDSGASQ